MKTINGGTARGTYAFEHDIKAIIVNKEVVDIRLDSEGRANMNDIHRAAGSIPKKRPGLFLANKKAKRLINDLESTAGIPAVLTYEGQGAVTGTFCHIDILLAYAAWIDADFYVTVAKTFDNEPWFVAKDVADAIGVVNVHTSLANLDESEKKTISNGDYTLNVESSGARNFVVISEGGMYTLVLRCRQATTEERKENDEESL